jgi:hypothetical protein
MYIRNLEPSVDEILSDPLIQLVMERDGSSGVAVRTLMVETKRRIEAEVFAGSKPRTVD